MPHPDNQRDEARRRLDEGLSAFDAKRARGGAPFAGDAGSTGEGYRLLAGLIGGLLGGLGLGWLFDSLARTSPIGLVVGLLIGIVLSTWSAVRTASRMSEQAKIKSGPVAAVPDDEDDD